MTGIPLRYILDDTILKEPLLAAHEIVHVHLPDRRTGVWRSYRRRLCGHATHLCCFLHCSSHVRGGPGRV
uniref:Uncharacterized protein n=1 Tax=Ornithodoros erraticus TaxID=265619 RepID=A0A293LIH0_ORNER